MAVLSSPQTAGIKTSTSVDSRINQRQVGFSSAPSERFSYCGAPVVFVPRRGRRLFIGCRKSPDALEHSWLRAVVGSCQTLEAAPTDQLGDLRLISVERDDEGGTVRVLVWGMTGTRLSESAATGAVG